MNWKIGEVAVCVKVGSLRAEDSDLKCPPLRYNGEYIIQNTYQCPKCRSVSLDVGLSNKINEDGDFVGTMCCTEMIPCKEVHWCSSIRFVKRKTKEEKIAEAIQEENYELAEQLKNQK